MTKSASIGLIAVTLFSIGAAIYMGTHPARPKSEVPVVPVQTVVGDPKGTNITMSNQPKLDTIPFLINKEGAAQVIKGLQLVYPTQKSVAPGTTMAQLNEAQDVLQYIANAIFKKYPDLIPKPVVDTAQKKKIKLY